MTKSIVLLGSTGSIGTQALDVAKNLSIDVVAMSAGKQVDVFEKQVREFLPKYVAMADEQAASDLKQRLADLDVKVYAGIEGICALTELSESNMVLNSVSGVAGLLPTLSAIKADKTIALANKETLVAGGSVVTEAAFKHHVKLLPVDSEHSAIFQCLQGAPSNGKAEKIILTCSGGPFFGKTKEELANITPKEALKHPNWNMGAKITIDSATMVNKGLELIEACWLFDMNPEQIEVVIHRESVIHSLVEYADGSVIGQLGNPDMRLPIQYALTYPERVKSTVKPLSLTDYQNLTFYKPDNQNFPAIEMCRNALIQGGLAPAAMNGANEQAVALFLEGRIRFTEIVEMIDKILSNHTWDKHCTLEGVLEADKESRRLVCSYVK